MPVFCRSVLAAAALLLAAPAPAQQAVKDTPAAATAEKDPVVPRVEVKASQTYDARRDDTASKTVIGAEELRKYGDTNIYDVLKRAPGVTVIGNSIRMRGLGAGYTQILVNGERPPPGFSLDDLPPDQIEKIEIMRAATAEYSMQAIAGTINIVLKKVAASRQRDVRLNGSASAGAHSVASTLLLANRVGDLSYFFNTTLSHSDSERASDGGDRFLTPDGTLAQLRTSASHGYNTSNALIVQPRLNWKLANDGQFNLGGFAQLARHENGQASTNDNRIGTFPAPDYVRRNSDTDSDSRYIGLDANWIVKVAGGKLDVKASLNRGRFTSIGTSLYETVDPAVALARANDVDSISTTTTSSGKFSRTLWDGHSLLAGWEASERDAHERSTRIDRPAGAAALATVEAFHSEVTRAAVFTQDEWNVTTQWSVYLGARWEGIVIAGSGTGVPDTSARFHVLSPVAQTLFKFPDKSGRQLRLALTRTFKAPDNYQLIARRSRAPLNTRFTPDSSGNPDLQPELATGVDLTYEHFWAAGAMFSVGGSVRRISGYIRTTLGQDADGLWLYRPDNDGNARVRTVDIELKFPLKTFWTAAHGIDLRAGVNRNWSTVDAVPGPDNRLDNQVPLTATAGIDYKADKLSTGASLAFRAGGPVRISAQQIAQQYQWRDLEAYVLYKLTPRQQLRVAASNLLRETSRSVGRYQDASGTSENWSYAHGYARVQASLELKF